MKRLLLGLLFGVLLILPARAQQEDVIITAAPETTTQTSSAITRHHDAQGLIVIIDVTAGSTLELDVNLQMYSPGLDSWIYISQNCPSNGGITGVATNTCLFMPHGYTDSGDYVTSAILEKRVFVPNVFRIMVEHGNANEATYTVRIQWVKD